MARILFVCLKLQKILCAIAVVCALNGKFSKSSLNKESPEGASPLCTGVTPGSISKSQGGLG